MSWWAFFHLFLCYALEWHDLIFVVRNSSQDSLGTEQVLNTALETGFAIAKVSYARNVVDTMATPTTVFRVVCEFVWIFRSNKFVLIFVGKLKELRC